MYILYLVDLVRNTRNYKMFTKKIYQDYNIMCVGII